MNVSLQLTIGMGAAHRNQYLFSDHYLNNLLPNDPRWSVAPPEAETFLAWLQNLYAREQAQFSHYNESSLEDHWFKPILTQLSHTFERQASIPSLEAGVNRPDYVFFPDEATRQAAVSAQRTEDYTADALAVGEVKRWDTALSKKRKGGGASFEAQNPSWQIDYYVRATSLDWGILSNGRLWRLVHKDSSQRLSIYYEVDLVDLLSRGDAGAMRYFTLFFRQAAFRPDAQGRIFLDDALAASNAYAVALEEDLEQNVYQALEHLMQGFLDLSANHLGPDDLRAIYDNSLYLLYRLLFILYGESRGLLPLQDDQYRTNYSLTRIKEDIVGIELLPAPMTTLYWGRLQNLFHIINGDEAELNRYLGVPRYNGRLFDPEQHPFLEEKAVGDRALIEAIDLLSRRVTEAGREFADYRTLGVRHLGSIYEGLLEYQPRYASEPMAAIRDRKGGRWVKADDAPDDANVIERRDTGQVYLETDRGERKATGSYYTPQYIVEYIVENTVGPLVAEAVERVKARAKAAKGKAARAKAGQSLVDEILNLKVLDPAMGSGHFLVEATESLALALATDPYVEAEAPAEEDLTYWKRRVVERCIYGVDKNPLAVELAKLSLWLATVAADRPLSFLDHHLRCGDSLIGARVEDLGGVPPVMLNKKILRERETRYNAGVRQANLFETRLVEKLPVVMGRILEITEVESKDYDTVRAKEAADQAVQQLKAPFKAVADLWVSAYFGNKFIAGEYDEALMQIGQPAALLALPAVQRAQALANEHRFFHWELAFPEVFYNEHGLRLGEQAGFDVVVGNPPYVRVQEIPHSDVDYYKSTFRTAHRRIDISVLFFEDAVRLISHQGRAAYISSTQFFNTEYGRKLRRLLLENTIHLVVDFGSLPVFEEATTYAGIIVFSRGEPAPFLYHEIKELPTAERADLCPINGFEIDPQYFSDDPWELADAPSRRLLHKLRESAVFIRLSECAETWGGVITGKDEIFNLDQATIDEWDLETDILLPLVRSPGVQRWFVQPSMWLLYPYEHLETGETRLVQESRLQRDFPNAYAYLKAHEDELRERKDSRKKVGDADDWYKIIRYGSFSLFESEKILTPGESITNSFGVDSSQAAFSFARVYAVIAKAVNTNFLAALLNSSILKFALHAICPLKRGGYYTYSSTYLAEAPIRRIEFTTPADERKALLEDAVEYYLAYLEHGEDVMIRAFVAARLEAEPEQADVVHDLLARLAGQMIEVHKEKQSRVEAFWLDLEGVTDAETFETLRNKGKWERTLWGKSKACRPFVDEESRSTRRLDESLCWNEEAFKVFVKALVSKVQGLSDLVGVYRTHSPAYRKLVTRIEATDRLIDQIVYQLYGLTEEEVALIEKQ